MTPELFCEYAFYGLITFGLAIFIWKYVDPLNQND